MFFYRILDKGGFFIKKDKMPDVFLCKRERNTFIKTGKRQPMT